MWGGPSAEESEQMTVEASEQMTVGRSARPMAAAWESRSAGASGGQTAEASEQMTVEASGPRKVEA